jgi:putative hydroxymethylpyrimidine transport system substrate-binding protein
MKMQRKKQVAWWVFVSVLGVSLLALVGCAKAATPTPSPVRVSLALDWYPNANHAGLYMAQERGYFQDEGLEVDLFTPADPATVLQTVASGRDDFGISYQVEVLLARQEEVPVVSIMGLVQHPLNVLMSLEESGIDRPEKLKGKKVGYPGIAYDVPLLKTMLEYDGASIEDVELVNVGFSLVPALVSEKVDAVIGAYVSHETIMAENQGYPVNVMRLEEWGVPDSYELVVVTSEKNIEESPEVIRRFLRAVTRGYEDAVREPQTAIDVLMAAYPEVDEAIERPGVDILVPLWKGDAPSIGWQEESRWVDFADWMEKNGLLEGGVDGRRAFTNEFLP